MKVWYKKNRILQFYESNCLLTVPHEPPPAPTGPFERCEGCPYAGHGFICWDREGERCPDATGFSPRSLRRMRNFCRTYESAPEVMAEAMVIGWTQNVVIMDAELSLQEKAWYIRAVRQFGWSKLKLAAQIAASAHLEISLDLQSEVCYTEENSDPSCSSIQAQADGIQRQPRRGDGVTAHSRRLRRVRPPDRDGPGRCTEYSLYLRRRCRQQQALADGLYHPSL